MSKVCQIATIVEMCHYICVYMNHIKLCEYK